MSLYRIRDGMAEEIWERFDMMEFLGSWACSDRRAGRGGAVPAPEY
jgi:hypothetical protein